MTRRLVRAGLFRSLQRLAALSGALGLAVLSSWSGAQAAQAASYVPISGSGSTWSSNALDQWRRDVVSRGIQINYSATGSSAGRADFISGQTVFGVSEIPFQRHPEPGESPEQPSRPYAYMPIVAGGTSFMYHLTVAGKQVTNLRLSGATVAKIFTGVITDWADPAITADYGAQLPSKPIIPVTRSDGSGTTAQFTLWMSKKYPDIWHSFCAKVGRDANCGLTSFYPQYGASQSLNGSVGVSSYVSAGYGDGAIGYVEYSYALNANYPVVKLLNDAGYYVEPTAGAVAVALTNATINNDENSPDYLTQNLDGVYDAADPRAYPLSSYSYMIIPTSTADPVTEEKGRTLADFAYYFLCQGQQAAPKLGYSPLPINLVQAAFAQVARIPGADTQNLNIADCNNPTFNPDGSNRLADIAPQPADCDKAGAAPCTAGTGGAATSTTDLPPAVAAPADGGAAAGADPAGGAGAAADPSGGGGGAGSAAGAGGTVAAPVSTPVSVPVGSTVQADGSVKSATGAIVAKAGTITAPAGSVVRADGTLKAPNGQVIKGSDAVAKSPSAVVGGAGTSTTGTRTAIDSATGQVVSLGGGSVSLGGGTAGGTGVAPVASSVQLAAQPADDSSLVLYVLAAAALLATVLVPPLLARRAASAGPVPPGERKDVR